MIRHALAPVVPSMARALGIECRVSAPGVALTFDDGPHPEGTPAILEILARTGACASFFLVGEQVRRRPALAAEILGAGHELALHCDRHRNQLRLTERELRLDLERGAAAIQDATGVHPERHRPPYGIYSPVGLSLARERYRPLLWSRWGKDWRRHTTPGRIAARATRNISSGDVILLHDADFYSSRYSHRRTTGALALIISELKRLELDTVLAL